MRFDFKQVGRPSTSERSLKKKCLNHQLSSLREFQQYFLPENPIELCDGLIILLQDKQAGNNSDIINEKTFAVVDRIPE